MSLGLAYRVEPELDERSAEREAEKFSSTLDEKISELEPMESDDMFDDSIMEHMEEVQAMTEEFGEFSVEGGMGEFATSIIAEQEPSMPGAGGAGGPEEGGVMSAALSGVIGDQLAGQFDEMTNILDSVKSRGQQTAMATGMLSKMFAGGLAGVVVGGLALNFLEGIVNSLAAQSPMLESVMGILGMALTLFFRPFGDILADLLLPIATSLLQVAAEFNSIVSTEGLMAGLAFLASTFIDALFSLDGIFVAAVTALGSVLGGFIGAKAGALIGAKIGAVVGSIIPGGGTVIGAGIGAVLGGLIGLIASVIVAFNVDLNEKLDSVITFLQDIFDGPLGFLRDILQFVFGLYVQYLLLRQELAEWLGESLSNVVEYLKGLFDVFQEDGISGVIGKLFEDSGVDEVFKQILPQDVLDAYQELKDFVEGDFDLGNIINDIFESAYDDAVNIAGNIQNDVQDELEDLDKFISNTWGIETSFSNIFGNTRDKIDEIVSDINSEVESKLEGLSNFVSNTFSIDTDLSSVFSSAKSSVTSLASDTISDVKSEYNELKSYFTNVFNLSSLENAFETAKNNIIGGNGIVGEITSDIISDLSNLNDYVENTFGVNISQSFLNVFDAAVEAIAQPFNQLNFSGLTNSLDDIADAVGDLISSLNNLSGVDISASIPDFDDVEDFFEGIFDNQEQEETYQPPDDDDDDGTDTNDDGGLDAGGFGDELGGDPAGDSGGFVSMPDPGSDTPGAVDTGGYVESTGLATIHEGERIVPNAQVTDRGETQFDISGMSSLLSDMSPSYSFDLPNVSVSNESPMERIRSIGRDNIDISDSFDTDDDDSISQRELERAFANALADTNVQVSNEEMRREMRKVRTELRRLRDEMELDVEFNDKSKWEVTK